MPTLSPWQILADAHEAKRARIAAAGDEGAAWTRSTRQLVDVLVRGEEGALGWRFANPRFRGLALALIDFVTARLEAHDAANDRASWLGQDLPDGAESFTTIELKTNFLATATSGTLQAVARAAHGGRNTQVWDATVTGVATGRTLALFRCTQMVLYPKS